MDYHDRHVSKKLMDNKNELISMIDKFKGESRNEVESKTKMLEDYASMIQDYVM